jgi:hypothetical protein
MDRRGPSLSRLGKKDRYAIRGGYGSQRPTSNDDRVALDIRVETRHETVARDDSIPVNLPNPDGFRRRLDDAVAETGDNARPIEPFRGKRREPGAFRAFLRPDHRVLRSRELP